MSDAAPIELTLCRDYAARTTDEHLVDELLDSSSCPALIVAEGFEERSLGMLRHYARRGIKLPSVVVARYADQGDLNLRYREQYATLAEAIAPGRWHTVTIGESENWISDVLGSVDTNEIAVDITGLSNRSLFCTLDALSADSRTSFIGYSEAAHYRPKYDEWLALKAEAAEHVSDPSLLAQKMDEREWLYGGEHRVVHIPGHEGYDVAGACALVAFLPFKPARLAAILARREYSDYLFVAGRPRLPENLWRLEAQKTINASLTKSWAVCDMSTFGYRAAMLELAQPLFSDDGLLHRYDVHLAPLGSKLQTVACWIVSRLCRSLTVLSCVPGRYFPSAFSEGTGNTWYFPFRAP